MRDGAEVRHVYSDAELHRLAAMVPGRGPAYVMFNNIPRVADAGRFQAIVGAPPMIAALR